MLFESLGDKRNPTVLFFHAMGVTGASSEPAARYLQKNYFCVMPTSTVYCSGQQYVSKADEVRQVEAFLRDQGVERLTMVVASSIGADIAMAFLTQTRLPVGHVFFDGGQFAQIGKAARRIMTPFLYLAIKSLYWSKGATLKKYSGAMMNRFARTSSRRARRSPTAICAARWRTAWRTSRFRRCLRRFKGAVISNLAAPKTTSNIETM